jgi:hypothetical protein
VEREKEEKVRKFQHFGSERRSHEDGHEPDDRRITKGPHGVFVLFFILIANGGPSTIIQSDSAPPTRFLERHRRAPSTATDVDLVLQQWRTAQIIQNLQAIKQEQKKGEKTSQTED